MSSRLFIHGKTSNIRKPYVLISWQSWISIEDLPNDGACVLFGARTAHRWLVKLSIRSDGKLELWTSAIRDPVILEQSLIPKGRWTHLTLVHHSAKSPAPAISEYALCHP